MQNYSLCPPTDLRDDDIAAVTDKLPASLEEAIEAARNSSFLSERLPENLLEHVLMEKTQEAKEYAACEDKDMFETIRYFYTL